MPLRHNKLCEIEDFESPELRSVLDDVFSHEYATFPAEWPHGVADTKQWECAMACRALRDLGALHGEAVILGVGAGTEITSYYLTKHARLVVATDRYLRPGNWEDVAPPLMLARPERFSPIPFDRNRLLVEHMDGRRLRFPDATFDGIFSSGSIEHFGSLAYVANAAFEMGRVLKPGGILTLSTEYKLAGPPGGDGWGPDTIIFSRDRIQKYIVEASGLEPVDELRTDVSRRTMECERDLETFLRSAEEPLDWTSKVARYPNLVLVHSGYVFTSIHLVLRKTESYPCVENAWARPSQATDAAILRDDDALERALPRASVASPVAPPASASHIEHDLAVFEIHHSGAATSRVARRLPRPLAGAYRSYLRVRYLATVWAAQLSLFRAFESRLTAQEHRAEALQSAMDVLDRSVDDRVLEATADLRAAQSDLERRHHELRGSEGRLEAHVDEIQGLETRLRTDLDGLESRVRDLRSRVRLVEYVARLAGDHDQSARLAGHELVAVIRETERLVPDLARSSAVDISIASDGAEGTLLDACEYLGERLSGSGHEYRMPNDAWIHIDLDGDSFDQMLVDNAIRKVKPDGLLVLVSDRIDWEKTEELDVVLDTRISPAPDGSDLQVCVLRVRAPA